MRPSPSELAAIKAEHPVEALIESRAEPSPGSLRLGPGPISFGDARNHGAAEGGESVAAHLDNFSAGLFSAETKPLLSIQ